MRLWHQDLLDKLDKQRLQGQHRECCALRGKGWKKKHSTVDYIFKYPMYKLYNYHLLVIGLLMDKGVKIAGEWLEYNYRGKQLGYQKYSCEEERQIKLKFWKELKKIYPEHNEEYMEECLENLRQKGIHLEV